MRIGQGVDVHRFEAGRRLMLGGVHIPHDLGLAGHSDGDALLHAIIDALLGAAAMGDIGGMFPSGDARWRDADSALLLAEAWAGVAAAGHGLVNVDATIVAERPRLASHMPAMQKRIAGILGAGVSAVSVKATTSDGLGLTGRGEGVAAFAVVLLDSVN
jgi:2-C-methyl-D-erythritol 2,4-cyclodiphosphate synthase